MRIERLIEDALNNIEDALYFDRDKAHMLYSESLARMEVENINEVQKGFFMVQAEQLFNLY